MQINYLFLILVVSWVRDSRAAIRWKNDGWQRISVRAVEHFLSFHLLVWIARREIAGEMHTKKQEIKLFLNHDQ